MAEPTDPTFVDFAEEPALVATERSQPAPAGGPELWGEKSTQPFMREGLYDRGVLSTQPFMAEDPWPTWREKSTAQPSMREGLYDPPGSNPETRQRVAQGRTQDLSDMTPAERIRYYFGLPEDYPMNRELIEKGLANLRGSAEGEGWAEGRDRRRYSNERGPLEAQVYTDLLSAMHAMHATEPERPSFDLGGDGFPADLGVGQTFSPESARTDALGSEEAQGPMFQWDPEGHPRGFQTRDAAAAHVEELGFRGEGQSLGQGRMEMRKQQARKVFEDILAQIMVATESEPRAETLPPEDIRR